MDNSENEKLELQNNALRARTVAAHIILIVTLFILAAMVMLSCIINDKRSTENAVSPSALFGAKDDKFESGTFVYGIDIGGLTAKEARAALEDSVKSAESAYECRLFYNQQSFTLKQGDVNLSTTVDEVLSSALREGSGSYEVEVVPIDDELLHETVNEIAKDIETPARNAELIELGGSSSVDDLTALNSRFAITKRTDGVKLDVEAAEALLKSGANEAELPVSIIPAEATLPELPVRRAVFYTSFASGSLSTPNRVSNINKAADIINGTELEAGEELSCNALLGERTNESGWEKATAFASGGSETKQQYGGGICQVSTTLYNCALFADLEITERHGHSRKVAYIEGGRDASLSWGTSDLKIKNNTSSKLYIYMWTDEAEKRLFCEIYGEAFAGDYDEIELISELSETIEPTQPEFTAEPELSSGECVLVRKAITGSVYNTYRLYKRNGETVEREKIATTKYPMHPALYAVAPSTESVSPSLTPEIPQETPGVSSP